MSTSLAGKRITPKTKRVCIFLAGIKSVQNSIAVIMVPEWSLCDPPVKSYILPIHRNRRDQTGKFRIPNIFCLALESFVLPLSTTYLKTKRVKGFAEERYCILFYYG